MFYVKIYISMFVCFLAVDLIWLGIVARAFYQKHLDFLLRPSPNWPIAILFYLIFLAGILIFVVVPSLQSGSLRKVIFMGALFGFVTYATYDLTNHATLKGWPWIVTIVDLCWGTVLCAIVATAGYLTGKWMS